MAGGFRGYIRGPDGKPLFVGRQSASVSRKFLEAGGSRDIDTVDDRLAFLEHLDEFEAAENEEAAEEKQTVENERKDREKKNQDERDSLLTEVEKKISPVEDSIVRIKGTMPAFREAVSQLATGVSRRLVDTLTLGSSGALSRDVLASQAAGREVGRFAESAGAAGFKTDEDEAKELLRRRMELHRGLLQHRQRVTDLVIEAQFYGGV